jgi:hypothetical protein
MDSIETMGCPGHPRHPQNPTGIRGVDEPESQNLKKIKLKDFLDGDPPLLLEFNCFVLYDCMYRTFYRLYQLIV